MRPKILAHKNPAKITTKRPFSGPMKRSNLPEISGMGWRDEVKEYFHFSRRDRIGVLVLTGLIAAVFLLPGLIRSGADPGPGTPDTAWVASLKKWEQPNGENSYQAHTGQDEPTRFEYQYDRVVNPQPAFPKGELFYFDPNTLPGSGWQKLGLREKTIGTILKYRSKGGRFRVPEDLQKIYGLGQRDYQRLLPYVRIAVPEVKPPYPGYESRVFELRAPLPGRYTIIDINTADTTAFIQLPGIGSKLAARIVNFRDKLGGFYSVEQVKETCGLADSVFQKIKEYLKLENLSLRKININTATVEELKAHPYIRYSLANPIISYRNQHGDFEKIEDLKKVMVVTEDIYHKILPYLVLKVL